MSPDSHKQAARIRRPAIRSDPGDPGLPITPDVQDIHSTKKAFKGFQCCQSLVFVWESDVNDKDWDL